MTDDSITLLDHRRLPPTETPRPVDATSGVYRVVGTDDATVTLLRVADADGRRRHTGELVRIDRDQLSAFEPADDPDGNRPLSAALVGLLDGLTWQLRAFGYALADRPLPSVVAGAVLSAGLVGDQFLSGPEWAFGVAIFVGSLALAAIGSARF